MIAVSCEVVPSPCACPPDEDAEETLAAGEEIPQPLRNHMDQAWKATDKSLKEARTMMNKLTAVGTPMAMSQAGKLKRQLPVLADQEHALTKVTVHHVTQDNKPLTVDYVKKMLAESAQVLKDNFEDCFLLFIMRT